MARQSTRLSRLVSKMSDVSALGSPQLEHELGYQYDQPPMSLPGLAGRKSPQSLPAIKGSPRRRPEISTEFLRHVGHKHLREVERVLLFLSQKTIIGQSSCRRASRIGSDRNARGLKRGRSRVGWPALVVPPSRDRP